MNAEQARRITQKALDNELVKQYEHRQCMQEIRMMASQGDNYAFVTGSDELFEELKEKGFEIEEDSRVPRQKRIWW